MYPHRIRLRGPWEATYQSGGQQIKQRITFPGTWGQLQSVSGPLTLARSFGRPRILDTDESVWLVWSDLAAACEIILNDQPPQSVAAHQRGGIRPIRGALNERNTLTLQFPDAGNATDLIGEFALEIRGPVYLDQVQIECEGGTRFITGLVSGAPRANLDLYLLVDGQAVHHEITQAEPAGTAFRIPCPEPAGPRPGSSSFPPIRIELVEGATCWWQADFSRESDIPAPPA